MHYDNQFYEYEGLLCYNIHLVRYKPDLFLHVVYHNIVFKLIRLAHQMFDDLKK